MAITEFVNLGMREISIDIMPTVMALRVEETRRHGGATLRPRIVVGRKRL
jgi:hypothetical protein